MPTLNWVGKDKVINHHRIVPYKVLEHKFGFNKNEGEVLTETKSGNKIIHGDNLEALKSLLPEYEGKIKCIYIDPPYNTGEESWVYNDNLNDPRIKKWFGQVVGKEAEDLTRHDKWLCMMYPRLKLLQKLLKDDGAIFISIDDNEYANLRLICDEIFGTSNFITNFIWEKRTNRENRKEISYRHDYVLAYRKNKYAPNSAMKKLTMTGEALARYKNPDNDPRGVWKSDPATAQSGHATQSQFYTVIAPNGKKHELQSGRCWTYTEDVMIEAIKDNRIWFGKDGKGVPRIKTYLDSKERGLVPETIWFADEVGTNESAKVNLKLIFDGKAEFQTPKPYPLIERILKLSTDHDSIVLDSFAGSGSTAHAVFEQNKKDGGNRKVILIETEDYAYSITAERIKRVINGYADQPGSEESFDYYELGEPLFIGENSEFINESLDTEKIREYIWYSETRSNYKASWNVTDSKYLLGTTDNTAYYFFFEKDTLMTFDYDLLAEIRTFAEQYVVYADNCLIPDEFLIKKNIVYKKIPRDITRF